MQSLKRAVLVLLGLFSVSTEAVEVRFAWDPNPADDGVTEYILYELPIATVPLGIPIAQITVVGTETTCVLDLVPGVHVFFVIARNIWADSLPSNTVTTPAGRPSAPTGFHIAMLIEPGGSVKISVDGAPWTTTHVEASPDLTSWKRIHSKVNVMGQLAFVDHEARGASQRFYRAVATAL